LAKRAELDKNAKLDAFAKGLEEVIISAVEAGHMTKDLAICQAGTTDVTRDKYESTEQFIESIATGLKAKFHEIIATQ